MSTAGPIVYADYGDAVLHRFGWYAPPSSSPLQVAACRALDEHRPKMLYLEHQAPDGATLCPWCELELRVPNREYGHRVRPGTVAKEPIREAFERSGLSLSELCRRLGFVRRDDKGYLVADTSILSRKLGIQHYGRSPAGAAKRQSNIQIDVAVRIVRALHLDPVDFGL